MDATRALWGVAEVRDLKGVYEVVLAILSGGEVVSFLPSLSEFESKSRRDLMRL